MCSFLRTFHTRMQGQAALRDVKGRELIGAIADDRNAESFEHLERAGEIENCLGAGADYGDGSPCEFREVGGNIEGGFRAAMYAANSAGGEDADSSAGGNQHGSGDGGRSGLALGENRGEIRTAHFEYVFSFGEGRKLFGGKADDETPCDDRDGGGDGAFFPDYGFHIASRLQILGPRKTVSNDGGFERDDCGAGLQSGSDVFTNEKRSVQESLVEPLGLITECG